MSTVPNFTLAVHHDPAHGWLAVPRSLIECLGLRRRISSCSYEDSDGMVYLEEDCDATLFLDTALEADWTLSFDEHFSDELSFIRQLPRYRLPEQPAG